MKRVPGPIGWFRPMRPGASPMPMVVRVVLPFAAGAMLTPLPTWTGRTISLAENAPIRAILSPAVLREDGWVESDIAPAGTGSEVRVSAVRKARTHRILTTAATAVAPAAYPPVPEPAWVLFKVRSGPDRCGVGFPYIPATRGPPAEIP